MLQSASNAVLDDSRRELMARKRDRHASIILIDQISATMA
jgi:hypothetical protein